MKVTRLLSASFIAAFTGSFILLLLGSCSSAVKPEKTVATELQLTLAASTNINSFGEVQSAPVQLRVYELNSDDLFNQADFLDLYNNDAVMLQSSLIKRHLMPTVWPGSDRTSHFVLDSETRIIAVLAEFSDYAAAVSKVVQPINRGEINTLILHIEENRLRFSASQK